MTSPWSAPTPVPWLTDPDPALLHVLSSLAPSLPPLVPAASEEAVDAVGAGECGEPLVVLPPELGRRHCYRELDLPTRSVIGTGLTGSGCFGEVLPALVHAVVDEALGPILDWQSPSTDAAHLLALESVGDDDEAHRRVARDLRRLLGQVLTGAGLAPYPLEWWHWSYGEQRWAAQHRMGRTIYAPVETP